MPVINIPARDEGSPFASMKGHHVAVRVPDFAAAKKWYAEKLDFRVVHEWPYADQHLAYVAPASDDTFFVEILGDGQPGPMPKPAYQDLGGQSAARGLPSLLPQRLQYRSNPGGAPPPRGDYVTEPFELPAIGRRLAFLADPWGNLIELAQVLA